MPLLSIVEDYVVAAMKHAEVEWLDNGMLAATVPECFGVVATGVDVHACAVNLYARLEDWARVSLERGHSLPVIDGIDLSTDPGRILATYHGGQPEPLRGEFLRDETELQAAFDRWEKEPAG